MLQPKRIHDLGALEWRVAGFIPHDWRWRTIDEFASRAEVAPVPMRLPGSVQAALRDAGILRDWYTGLSARECEWVENRHWVVYADLPDEWCADEGVRRLCFEGLDYEGVIRVNGREAGVFRGSFVPHLFDIGRFLEPTGNSLEIVFTDPPRWLGQMGFTSRMTEWKTRFNYTWDWTSRVVQLGVPGAVTLEAVRGAELEGLRVRTDVVLAGEGVLTVNGQVSCVEPLSADIEVHALLTDGAGGTVREESIPRDRFDRDGLRWEGLPVELWWPSGEGPQPLYRLTIRVTDGAGEELDRDERTVGFRSVEWLPCEGAPADARPWICSVNRRPLFLQGVNWTPVRPTYADVTPDEIRERVTLYRDLGCNILRVWGGATLETEAFYEVCDELGMLVWQEFPLSSSGFDNWPPEDPVAVEEMGSIAESYIARRAHHTSLIIWCGGNELQGAPDGGTEGIGKPVDESHPMIAALARVVERDDPGRRFLPTSSSGPRFGAEPGEFGLGLHHDVHGPWQLPEGTLAGAQAYWAGDDALFRSEVGVAGASPVDVIEEYAGDLPVMPASGDNPLWRRTSWWIQWPEFLEEVGREPTDLAEFVAWSQERQAKGLVLAAKSCKSRFPRCGGFIVWMGHDCFPCTANTAIVDFHGRPKPAALALKQVFTSGARTPTDR